MSFVCGLSRAGSVPIASKYHLCVKGIDARHVDMMGGAALSPTKGNVTAVDP